MECVQRERTVCIAPSFSTIACDCRWFIMLTGPSKRPAFDDGGWQPSVVIQGKLYHKIGPLNADDEHAPAFAQLYVYENLSRCADDVTSGGATMVYVKFDLKFRELKFHCNFTTISTPVFGLRAIAKL